MLQIAKYLYRYNLGCLVLIISFAQNNIYCLTYSK